MNDQKTCFKCLRSLPVSDFYKHPMTSDGRLGKCKECTKSDTRANYRKSRVQRKTYEAERAKRPSRKAKQREYARRMKERSPHKYAARNAVANALRSGALKWRPCEVCDGIDMVEAHHPDYSKPLDVKWLCFRHHMEAHGKSVIGAEVH